MNPEGGWEVESAMGHSGRSREGLTQQLAFPIGQLDPTFPAERPLPTWQLDPSSAVSLVQHFDALPLLS